MIRIRYLLLGMVAGCSGSSPAPPVQPPVLPPPPVVNDSPGGVWSGTRPNGTDIIVLVSEDGGIRKELPTIQRTHTIQPTILND